MKNRLFALLLALVLALNLLPVAALADADPAPAADSEEVELTPEPEAEPEATPEPTAIPEPTATPEATATPQMSEQDESFSVVTTALDGDTGVTLLTQAVFDDYKGDVMAEEEGHYEYSLPGGSYKLDEDITYKGQITIPSGAVVTIDLNGHSLTQDTLAACKCYGVKVAGSFTLTGNGSYTAAEKRNTYYSAYEGIQVDSGAVFTLAGGTINSAVRLYGGTMNANGGAVYGYVLLKSDSKITSASDPATAFYTYTSNTDATENSVKSESGATISAGSFYGKVQNLGTITGGTFSGAVNSSGTITGGTFTGTVTNSDGGKIQSGTFTEQSTVTNNAGATIFGGTFTGTVDNKFEKPTHCGKVSGGDFSNAISLTNVFKVTFDLDGGTISDSDTIAPQYRAYTMVTRPSGTPYKSGSYFVGWYNGTTAWSFGSDGVNQDITLTAKWGTTQRATVVKDPEAITGLVYNGTAQELITAGKAGIGTMVYGINGGTLNTPIPTATDAGTYKITYKAAAGKFKNVIDSLPQSIYVDIAKATPTIKEWPTVNTPVYAGRSLSNEALSGGSAVDINDEKMTGSFTAADTILAVGGNTVTITFTPDESYSKNYGTATTTITVTAVKRTISAITAPNAITDKTCGTAIDDLGLPTAVKVSGDGFTETAAVTWDTSGYNAYSTQTQTFTGTLSDVYEKSDNLAVTISVTLQPITLSAPTFVDKTATYTGSPISHTLEANTGVSSVKYEYEGKNGTTYAKSETAPTNAGIYTVTASFTMETGYKQLTPCTSTLTIQPKSIAATTVSVDSLTYSGAAQTPQLAVMVTGYGRLTRDTDYTIAAASSTNGATSATDVGNYALVITGQGNYTGERRVEWSIAQKSTTPTITVAAGPHYYSGAAQKPDVTVKDGSTVIPASEYEVAYNENVNAGTASVTVTDKSGGNYSLATAAQTFTISPRPVTITSADNSKAYDGTEITNNGKTVSVTGEGMVAGEAFAFDFTASQIDIGSTDNTFTVRETDTAKLANYAITTAYGKLTVTVPADVAAPVGDITAENVKETDRETIRDTLDAVDDYLDMKPSEDEKESLEDLKDRLNDLLDRLDAMHDATEDKAITRVEDITADNAAASDKKKLEQAKEAIEDILANYGGNLAEREKKALEADLDRIEAALDAIEQAEQAKEKETENEKQQAVKTGDDAMPLLYLALALSAAAALACAVKKRED